MEMFSSWDQKEIEEGVKKETEASQGFVRSRWRLVGQPRWATAAGLLRPAVTRGSRRLHDLEDEPVTEEKLTTAKSLVDICSRFVAHNFPFEFVEHREPPVAEELQLKIIHFSFPDNQETVLKFAKFSKCYCSLEDAKSLSRTVTDLHQIGLRLSGCVRNDVLSRKADLDARSTDRDSFAVLYFDRGKITEAYCTSCCITELTWCKHVLAVVLARIDRSKSCSVRLPISDSLNKLNREQLLKFAQYHLTEFHKKPAVMESAQSLLDRLLETPKPQASSERGQLDKDHAELHAGEDLNSIRGAPDPTAGPGIGDNTQWFICQKSFEAYSVFKVHSLKHMGFLVDEEDDHCSSMWSKWRDKKGFAEDGLKMWLEELYKSCEQSSLKNKAIPMEELEAAFEILKQDYGTAMEAIVSWTDDILEQFEHLCLRPAGGLRQGTQLNSSGDSHKEQYSPSLFCWNISGVLAKLWRVAVLNPCLADEYRAEILNQCQRWKTKWGEISSYHKTPKHWYWPGFDVPVRMLQLDLHRTSLQAVYEGNTEVLPLVVTCCVVHLQCMYSCEKTKPLNENKKLMPDNARTSVAGSSNTSDSTNQSQESMATIGDLLKGSNGKLTQVPTPHLLQCGDFLQDVNTYIAVAEALRIFGHVVQATNLACAVSLSLLESYHGCFKGRLPVGVKEVQILSTSCSTGESSYCDSTDKDVHKISATHLSLPNVALLYSILSSESNIVERWWQKFGNKQEGKMEGDSVSWAISSAVSLRFQLGCLGFLLPRLPAAFCALELKVFQHERWLMCQLIDACPSKSDVEFLTQCLDIMSCSTAQLAPPVSLAHLLFHHTFKQMSSIGSIEALTSEQKHVLERAVHILGSSIGHVHSSQQWQRFLAVTQYQTANFAEQVFRAVAPCSALSSQVLQQLTKPAGLFGEEILEAICTSLRVASYPGAQPNVAVCANAALPLYAVSMALQSAYKSVEANIGRAKQSPSFSWKVKVSPKGRKQDTEELEPTETLLEKANNLKISQRRLLLHTMFLTKSTSSRQECEVEKLFPRTTLFRNMMNHLDSPEKIREMEELNSEFLSVFNSGEVLGICDAFLKSEDATPVDIVQQMLTQCMSYKASEGQTEEMKRIIKWFPTSIYKMTTQYNRLSSYRRRTQSEPKEGEHKQKRLPFLVGVCKQLLLLSSSTNVSFEVLDMSARTLISIYKDLEYETTVTLDRQSLLVTAYDLSVLSLRCVEEMTDNNELENNKLRVACNVLLEMSSNVACDQERSTYMNKFLRATLASVETPPWIFAIIETVVPLIVIQTLSARKPGQWRGRRSERKQFKEACRHSPLLTTLLERCCVNSKKLLRGQKLNEQLEDLSEEPPFRGRNGPFSGLWYERRAFDKVTPDGKTTLQECLTTAKEAFSAFYDEGESKFRQFCDQLEQAHPIISVLNKEMLNSFSHVSHVSHYEVESPFG